MRKFLVIGIMALAALTIEPAYADGHSMGAIKKVKTSIGNVLAGTNGMSLYTFDKDTAGKSNCNGGCANAWPPLMADRNAKDHDAMTVIHRADGSRQWAYKGAPLYFWQGDKKSGDVTGDGVNKVWHVAKP